MAMGKVYVRDLARMIGMPLENLIFKLRSIGVRVEGPDAMIETEVLKAVLEGKQLATPREVLARTKPDPRHATAPPTPPATLATQPEPSVKQKEREFRQEKDRFRVFLCHASTDKPAVRNLYQRLLYDRIHPWLDEEELLPGQKWRLEIERVLRNIPAVIVCLSRNSVTKQGYVQKEIAIALDALDQQPDGAIHVVPARLEECDVPDRLQNLHYCNLYTEAGYNRLLLALRFRARQLGFT
jgi:hypothetical protein